MSATDPDTDNFGDAPCLKVVDAKEASRSYGRYSNVSCTWCVPYADCGDGCLGILVRWSAGGKFVTVEVNDHGVDPAPSAHILLDRHSGVNRPRFPAASFSSRGGWLYAE